MRWVGLGLCEETETERVWSQEHSLPRRIMGEGHCVSRDRILVATCGTFYPVPPRKSSLRFLRLDGRTGLELGRTQHPR